MSNPKGDRLVFVAGPPRSGTTLVQNILDSHPQIAGAPEFRHIRHLVEIRNALHRDIREGSLDDVHSRTGIDTQFGRLIESLLLPFADAFGCKFVSEKTPKNILVFSGLLELFPAARFIIVIRDPRGIVASLLQVRDRMLRSGMRPTGPAATFGAALGHTKQYLAAGFRAKEAAPDRVMDVCYETLVADPLAETKRICGHLGLQWDEAVMNPSRFPHPGETAITDASGNVWYTRPEFNHDPDPHRVGKWRDSLTGAQQARICTAFSGNRELALLGYDLSTGSLSRLARAQGRVREGAWAMGSRVFRTRFGRGLKRVGRHLVR